MMKGFAKHAPPRVNWSGRHEYETATLPTPEYSRARKIRSSRRWQLVRDLKIKKNPLCEDCGAPAAEVHHVLPVVARPDLAFTLENLRSLCRDCHARQEKARG